MATKLSYESVAPHFFNLRLSGYYQIDSGCRKLSRIVHRFYMGFVLILMLLYTTQQALKVYETRKNMGQVMGTMFLFLTHTDAIYKQILMWFREKDIESFLEVMKGPTFNQGEMGHAAYLLKTARQAKMLLFSYNGLAVATCFLWFVYPIYLHLSGISLEFSIWLPYDENEDPLFYVTAFYTWITTTWLAFSNTTMIVLISTLLVQTKTQLQILSYNLSNIKNKTKRSATCSEFVFEDQLKRVVRHHEEIVKFAKNIENIFGSVLAYHFLISGWIICISVYRLVEIEVAYVECVSMVTYIVCILFEMFIYCYNGSEVTHESTNIKDAAYAMNWVNVHVKSRRILIVFMERIKRPMYVMAGHIIPLSNRTFVSVVKSSYSFYALLKSTSE